MPDLLLHAACLGAAFLVPVVFWHSAQSSFELPKQLALRLALWSGVVGALARWLAGNQPISASFLPPMSAGRMLLPLSVTAVAGAWLLSTLLSTAPELS